MLYWPLVAISSHQGWWKSVGVKISLPLNTLAGGSATGNEVFNIAFRAKEVALSDLKRITLFHATESLAKQIAALKINRRVLCQRKRAVSEVV